MAKFKDEAGRIHEIEIEFSRLLPAGCVEISEAEADALTAEFKKSIADNMPYDALRTAAYPSITDQLDAIMKSVANGDIDAGPDLVAVAERCMEVKEQFPKPKAE